MTDIVLFGGTTEGRIIAELLQKKGVSTVVCVATEYGESLLVPARCGCTGSGWTSPAWKRCCGRKSPAWCWTPPTPTPTT